MSEEKAEYTTGAAITLDVCPFCGNINHIFIEGINNFWAQCFNCGVGTRVYPTRAEAAAAWNQRTCQHDRCYSEQTMKAVSDERESLKSEVESLTNILEDTRIKVERLQSIVDRSYLVELATYDDFSWFAEKSWWDVDEWRIVKRCGVEGEMESVLLNGFEADAHFVEDPATSYESLASAMVAFNEWRKQCQQEK